jgi:chaperonin cofactor prefoldin
MRIGVLSKQEEKARPRLEEIRSKLEKALAQNKLSQ